ncbi:MAG: extracellular solute-binding protein [Clostridia bacterium]
MTSCRAFWPNGTYKDEIYGIALFHHAFIFAYRKDLFEKAGLDPEAPPKTWDELKEYAYKLTEKEGYNHHGRICVSHEFRKLCRV